MLTDNFIPNLPVAPVGKVIVKNEPETVNALGDLGIKTLHPERDNGLQEEVSEHSDMLCCFAGGKNCVLAPGQEELAKELLDIGFDVYYSEKLYKDYPHDILLNVALAGNYAVGCFRYTDKTLLRSLEGKKLINVKQGYAKCSVCFVTENAVITEDEGIASALVNAGTDVLLISKGDIYLSDKHFGFFGGSSGKLSSDSLAVNGSLDTHSDGERIKAFCGNYGVNIIQLTNGKIKDIGGILPLI